MLKFLVKLVVLLLAVGAGRLAYDKVLDLPLFALKQVKIVGNWKTSADSLMTITGLEKGKSIYKQDLQYAARRLMRQPGIVGCLVERGLLGTITVRVDVAEPALLVNSRELNALSREGMILPMSKQQAVLPLVSGRKFASALCYDRLKDPDIAYALELYDALLATSPGLGARLSEINFGDEGTLRLYFSPAGTEILMNKFDIENSVKRLAVLSDSGILADTATFDLRYGPVTIESIVGGAL